MELIQFDDQFRPILRPEFHYIRPPSAPILAPPDRAGANAMSSLDASLRNRTGVLYTTRHFLTHDAEDKAKRRCWTCEKAGPRQRKKFLSPMHPPSLVEVGYLGVVPRALVTKLGHKSLRVLVMLHLEFVLELHFNYRIREPALVRILGRINL